MAIKPTDFQEITKRLNDERRALELALAKDIYRPLARAEAWKPPTRKQRAWWWVRGILFRFKFAWQHLWRGYCDCEQRDDY